MTHSPSDLWFYHRCIVCCAACLLLLSVVVMNCVGCGVVAAGRVAVAIQLRSMDAEVVAISRLLAVGALQVSVK